MMDPHAASELELFIDNDGELYRQQTLSILKNLATKRAQGKYKHDLAVKAFGYLVEAGAKKYAKEYGSRDQSWHKMFDVATRKRVAEELTKGFETEVALGNYDSLLPKKYQKPVKSSNLAVRKTSTAAGHATKKRTWNTPESIKVIWSPVNSAYFALWPGRGAIKDQQVLKIAGAEEMHDWLRETYGDAFGLADRVSGGRHHSVMHRNQVGAPHAPRRKSRSQLDDDIAGVLATHRRGR